MMFELQQSRKGFLIAFLQQFGLPYLWDGKGLPGEPYNGRDCSGGVTFALYVASGGKLDWRANYNTTAMWDNLEVVEFDDAVPGDLFLYGTPSVDHVMVGIFPSTEWVVAGFAGGGHTTTSITVAGEQDARFKFQLKHTYRSDFRGIRRIPWLDQV